MEKTIDQINEEIKDLKKQYEKTAKDLREITTKTALFFNEDMKLHKGNISSLVNAFRVLGEFEEQVSQMQKVLKSIYNEYSYEIIPDVLETLELDSVKSNGRLFTKGVRRNASIPEDQKEKGFEWLRENGLGALIKEGVNSQALSAAVRSYIDEYGKKPPEECIKVHDQRYISVRKS